MGNRTIKSPGVEIIEHDLSSYVTTNLGTGCLIAGFAQKGEDLEPIKITNRSSWLLNFGAPTNEAEEYFYNAGMEVLNQGGFLHAAKIPYSNDIAGIYAAAKFKINANRGLYKYDENAGMFYADENDVSTLSKDDQKKAEEMKKQGEEVKVYLEDQEDQPGEANGRFYTNYRSLKDLGINSLSLIAPSGQDFLSKDLVEEYETGESKPNDDVIYIVDKTRAIYTRATEISDKQENRDARACIGIVPVITTLCNTAWFQKKTTGVESDVDELYQPIRSLRTIEFPAGAASAAEYKPTTFVKSDLHTQLMKGTDAFVASLAEMAATKQSCLVDGNLVDGKFKPFVANDVCVVVFKALVSTEDGKIDFEAVEAWVGSLDPQGRDEKGRTTFIDTIINNNSEYIYFFSNLSNPKTVLTSDHGFVAGSDSQYADVEEKVNTNNEYMAASLFSAYAARMLGFGEEYDPSDVTSLAAPRDFTLETIEDNTNENSIMKGLAQNTMGSLRAFYNQDAKAKVCTLDELVYSAKYTDFANWKTESNIEVPELGGYIDVSDKYITAEPSIVYTIHSNKDDDGNKLPDTKGDFIFNLSRTDDSSYTIESYDYNFLLGEVSNEKNYSDSKYDTMKLFQLSILNSTDYLRAIYDFESLVKLTDLLPAGIDEDSESYEEQIALARQKAIQALIINSIEKSGVFKARLRYYKKARINLDRLDDNYNNAKQTRSENREERKIGIKYIEDIYKSYYDVGLLSGIKFVEVKADSSASTSASEKGILTKKDALEAKLDEIVNIDTSKPEKMKARLSKTEVSADVTLARKYAAVRIYLLSQMYSKRADLLKAIANILEDCAYAQQRYVESQRNIDDANIMLGFYPEMAEPIITYTTIAQSLNKIFDEMSDVHTSEIDVVCDAGISNIAQFVKQVYDPSADDGEDVGGLYEPVKYASYFKFNKNTDLAYWKTIVWKYDTFCKFRGDCMFCTEGPRHLVLTGNKQVVRKTKKDTSVDLNILPYLSKIAGINTSYGAGYLNWYRTISDYTGDTLWVPPSIKAMGTYILTDKQYNWWDAPAGMRRGIINMVETSFNPNRIQAGEIYDINWNYAIHYINDGIIQEGQKTFQTRQSALDRVNVRRLIGRIKRYVYFASRQFLYEPHTAAVREKYVKTLKPFFEDLVNRGGLYDFKIICDSSNNTPEVIDRNELRVKIGIKPVKTIEFIIVDLCVLNTGASWNEMDSI